MSEAKTSPRGQFCAQHCGRSISACNNSRSTPRYHKLRDEDLDDLTMLIARLAAHADHSAIGPRARRVHLFDFAEDVERVAGPRRLRPADLSAASDDTASQRQSGLDE